MVEAGEEQFANGRRKWRANVGVGSIAVVESSWLNSVSPIWCLMAAGDSFRLDSAIHKWHKVVSSYDYNMSRTSLQTTIIINEAAEKRINNLLYTHFALF